MFIERRNNEKNYLVADFGRKRVKIFITEKVQNSLIEKASIMLTRKVIDDDFGLQLYNIQQYRNIILNVIYRSLLSKCGANIGGVIPNVELHEHATTVQSYYSTAFDIVDNNIITDFVVNSNQTEGSRLAVKEVQKLLAGKTVKDKTKSQDIQEFWNTREAWWFVMDEFSFNTRSIKRLYHILTKDLMAEDGEPYPRGFKKRDNMVGNSKTTPAAQVTDRVDELLQRYKTNKYKIHPFQLAFEFYFRFERIHPFQDGNGRVGRLLLNKILIAQGYLPMIIFAENRRAHFQAFEKGIEDKRKWYRFMIDQYEKSLRQIDLPFITID